MTKRSNAEFSFLVGRPLDAVTFILDYYQLVIGAYTVSIYTHPVVQQNGETIDARLPGYRDALCKRIGSPLVNTLYSAEELELQFADGTEFKISLRPEHRIGSGSESLVVGDATGVFIVAGDSEPTRDPA